MADSRMGKATGAGGKKKSKKTSRTKATRGSAKQARSSQTQTRSSRRDVDRAVTENRQMTDEERLTEFRKSFFQSVLPDLPEIEGYHVCWLTTTNPRDPIAGRIRLGYEPVRQEDVPGWEYASLKTGEYAGCIGVNEMVAFKLPLSLYQAYMAEAHHHQPQAEEEKLSSTADLIREKMAGEAKSGEKGILIEQEPGTEELGRERPVPTFDE